MTLKDGAYVLLAVANPSAEHVVGDVPFASLSRDPRLRYAELLCHLCLSEEKRAAAGCRVHRVTILKPHHFTHKTPTEDE